MATVDRQSLTSAPGERRRWRTLGLAAAGIVAVNSILGCVINQRGLLASGLDFFAIGLGCALQTFLFGDRLFAASFIRQALAWQSREALIYGVALPPQLKKLDTKQLLGRWFAARLVVTIAVILLFGGVLSRSLGGSPETTFRAGMTLFFFAFSLTPSRMWAPVLASILFASWSRLSSPRPGVEGIVLVTAGLVEVLTFGVLQAQLREFTEFVAKAQEPAKRALKTTPWSIFAAALVAAILIFKLVPGTGLDLPFTPQFPKSDQTRLSDSQIEKHRRERDGGPSNQVGGERGDAGRPGKGKSAGGGSGKGAGSGPGSAGGAGGSGGQGGSDGEQGGSNDGQGGGKGRGKGGDDLGGQPGDATVAGTTDDSGAPETGGERDAEPGGHGGRGKPAGKTSGKMSGKTAGKAAGRSPANPDAPAPLAPLKPESAKFKFPEVTPELWKKIFLALKILGALAAGLLGWWLWRRRKTKNEPKVDDEESKLEAAAKFRDECRRALSVRAQTAEELRALVVKLDNLLLDFYGSCGAPREEHVTPNEFALVHLAVAPTKWREMSFVTELFCRCYYGKQAPRPEQARDYVKCIAALGVPLDFQEA